MLESCMKIDVLFFIHLHSKGRVGDFCITDLSRIFELRLSAPGEP